MFVQFFIQQIGLQAFCDEISSLRLLIHSAAKAATKPGLAFPSIEGHLRDVKSFRRRSATVPGDNYVGQNNTIYVDNSVHIARNVYCVE